MQIVTENNGLIKQTFPLTAANATALGIIHNTTLDIRKSEEINANLITFGEAAVDTNDKMQLAAPTIDSMSQLAH